MAKSLNLPKVGEHRVAEKARVVEKVALVGERVGLVAELKEGGIDGEQVRIYLTKGAAGAGEPLLGRVFLGVFDPEYFDGEKAPEPGALQKYHEGFKRGGE